MKKTVNFRGLSKIVLIIAAAVAVAGIAILAIFGGKTFSSYTFANLSVGLILKAVVAGVLVCALTLLYFVIRFKKNGVIMGLISSLGAAVNAVVAFALCIICRANLGDMTFAVVLMAVALSYITFVLFYDGFTVKSTRKKNAAPDTDNYTLAANNAFKPMIVVLALICIVLAGAFVVSLVFGAGVFAFYAIPAILTAVFSVVFTLAFTCKLYADKA